MPSFTYELKSELVRIKHLSIIDEAAELKALLKVGAQVSDNKIDFLNTNAAVARRVLSLVKKIYPNVKTAIAVIRTKKLRKTNQYLVRIFQNAQFGLITEEILKNKNIKSPEKKEIRASYLRGAFLANGSINRPEAQYHLEIKTTTKTIAKIIEKLMKSVGVPAKIYERKGNYVVYTKNFEAICDFLYVIKAYEALEKFEIAQNLKEVKAQVNRIVNCETANLQKAVDAAQRQIQIITTLQEKGIKLSSALKETAKVRLENPSATMPELAEKLFISTSGLKHRMKKIIDLYDNNNF